LPAFGSGTDGGSAQLWNPHTRQPIGSPFATSNGGATSAAFLNSHTLITDDADGTVQLWNVAQVTGLPLPFGGSNESSSYSMATFSPNGTLLATITSNFSPNDHSAGAVQLWDAHTLRPIGGPIATGNGGASAAAFSYDGTMLATVSAGTVGGNGGTVQLWSTQTRRPIGKPFAGGNGGADWAAFSPDGAILATLSQGTAGADTVQMWNARTQKPVGGPFAGGNDGTVAVVFSPDGRMLATVSGESTVQLWDAHTRLPMGSPFTTSTREEAIFSPDSCCATLIMRMSATLILGMS